MRTTRPKTWQLAGWYTVLCAACSGDPAAATLTPGLGATPGTADCSAGDTLQATSVVELVTAVQHAYSYSALDLFRMNALIEAVHALDQRDLDRAADAARDAGYRLQALRAASTCYWLLQPPGYPGAIEQALILYAPGWRRNLVIEAPHAHEDHNTDSESGLLFERVRAKALVISGSHRCVQGVATSGCHLSSECSHRDLTTGKTPAIPPSDSDPAHSINNAVNATHLAFRGSEAIELQLHTNFHPELNGDALVSNGSRYSIPFTAADRLYGALRSPDLNVRSCNDAALPPTKGAFCGETNTQSLASNGAADTCLGRPTMNGDARVHRFIHLEQSNYQLCRPTDLGVNALCLGSFETFADRLGAAIEVAFPAEP
jgi:hypothetical protein